MNLCRRRGGELSGPDSIQDNERPAYAWPDIPRISRTVVADEESRLQAWDPECRGVADGRRRVTGNGHKEGQSSAAGLGGSTFKASQVEFVLSRPGVALCRRESGGLIDGLTE